MIWQKAVPKAQGCSRMLGISTGAAAPGVGLHSIVPFFSVAARQSNTLVNALILSLILLIDNIFIYLNQPGEGNTCSISSGFIEGRVYVLEKGLGIAPSERRINLKLKRELPYPVMLRIYQIS